jgi:hypothetical protein
MVWFNFFERRRYLFPKLLLQIYFLEAWTDGRYWATEDLKPHFYYFTEDMKLLHNKSPITLV